MNFSIECPINKVSLGQVSFGLLHEMFERKLIPNIFPIGEVELEPFEASKEFRDWLVYCVNKANKSFRKDQLSIKLWHIGGSHSRISDKAVLFTPHETDQVTPEEKNICSAFSRVYFTSRYSEGIFKKAGVENASYCPNYFDSRHFSISSREYKGTEGVITFGVGGKIEKRKNTLAVIGMWAEKFGGDSRYRLNCFINNPFLPPERQFAPVYEMFKGNIPWNINFIPQITKNTELSESLNSVDIDLSGMSGAEGFNLFAFNMLCLGKQAVVLNAHAHKDFANENNSILVEPSKKIPIYDNVFFSLGHSFNQGDMFIFEKSDFHAALDKAVEVAKEKNIEGMKLQEEFSVGRTLDILLGQEV